MKSDLLLLLAAAALAGACATASPPPEVPPPMEEPAAGEAATDAGAAPAEPAPPPAAAPAAGGPHTLCWTTEEQVTLAAGGTQPGARRVLRMTYEPAAGRVVHEALRFDPNPRVSPRLFTVTWRLDGDAFTLSDPASRIGGRGSIAGAPWPWSGWSADSRIDSGIRIAERATLRDDGVLLLEREAYGPDGGLVMTLVEEGQPLADDECARRLAEAGAPSGAQ